MRTIATLTAAALLAAGGGCAFLKRIVGTNDATQATGTGPIEPRSAADLVGYLNRQSDHLTSVRYPDVSISITSPSPGDPKRTEHHTLGSSMIVAARPKNFLLVGGKGITGDLVHIGSNDREFWMLTRPPLDQTYVFCSHADFQGGKGELPIPFDPDWALQALGMASYDPNLLAKVDVDERHREYVLSFDGVTPQGQPIKKQVVFAADAAARNRPQVKRHLVLDAAGRTIASAEVKEVATVDVNAASIAKGNRVAPAYVQMPTRVLLDWPQHRFQMDLKLRDAKVNEAIPDAEAQQLFTRPTIRGVNPINLAEARFSPNARGAMPRR